MTDILLGVLMIIVFIVLIGIPFYYFIYKKLKKEIKNGIYKNNNIDKGTTDNGQNYYWIIICIGIILFIIGPQLLNKGISICYEYLSIFLKYFLVSLYVIWLIIKRPLIIVGLLGGIYGLVKFIKRCREH